MLQAFWIGSLLLTLDNFLVLSPMGFLYAYVLFQTPKRGVWRLNSLYVVLFPSTWILPYGFLRDVA